MSDIMGFIDFMALDEDVFPFIPSIETQRLLECFQPANTSAAICMVFFWHLFLGGMSLNQNCNVSRRRVLVFSACFFGQLLPLQGDTWLEGVGKFRCVFLYQQILISYCSSVILGSWVARSSGWCYHTLKLYEQTTKIAKIDQRRKFFSLWPTNLKLFHEIPFNKKEQQKCLKTTEKYAACLGETGSTCKVSGGPWLRSLNIPFGWCGPGACASTCSWWFDRGAFWALFWCWRCWVLVLLGVCVFFWVCVFLLIVWKALELMARNWRDVFGCII